MPVSNRSAAGIAVVSALAAAGITAAVLPRSVEPDMSTPSERSHRIHEMGGEVMPFSLDQTTHVFEMTDSGGIQDVVAKESQDTATVRLIRQHLSHEAELFRRGDFQDPMSLHGAEMPGVRALSAGADRVRVSYETLSDGARITFATDDPALLTAIHRWFGAQLSDHAGDATYR
jgi:hypothetical protein